MPNALQAGALMTKKVLLLGDTGNGKTSQFLTLPGKKYAYLFDPNALNSLRGFDLDYDEYLPTTVAAAVASMSAGDAKKDPRSATTSSMYQQWEQQFNQRLTSGFFDPYDWIGFDSVTTFLDLIMDRVLTINGRFGQWPQQDDWGPQMMAFTNVCRTVTAMGKNLFMTGHMQDKENRKTGKVKRGPMMTGQLAQKIPLLFSDVLGCEVDIDVMSDPPKSVYKLHTVPNNEFTVIRTSIKGLSQVEDVTIDWSKDPVGQGLGGILNWERKQLNA